MGPVFPVQGNKERGVWKVEWGDQESREEGRGQVWDQLGIGVQIQKAEKYCWGHLQCQSHLLLIQKMRVEQGELPL